MSESAFDLLQVVVMNGKTSVASIGVWKTKQAVVDCLKGKIRDKYENNKTVNVVDMQEEMEEAIFHGNMWREPEKPSEQAIVIWLCNATVIHEQ